VLKSGANEYYDLQVKNTISNTIYEIVADGACRPVEI
jgi:hypothetical protein